MYYWQEHVHKVQELCVNCMCHAHDAATKSCTCVPQAHMVQEQHLASELKGRSWGWAPHCSSNSGSSKTRSFVLIGLLAAVLFHATEWLQMVIVHQYLQQYSTVSAFFSHVSCKRLCGGTHLTSPGCNDATWVVKKCRTCYTNCVLAAAWTGKAERVKLTDGHILWPQLPSLGEQWQAQSTSSNSRLHKCWACCKREVVPTREADMSVITLLQGKVGSLWLWCPMQLESNSSDKVSCAAVGTKKAV